MSFMVKVSHLDRIATSRKMEVDSVISDHECENGIVRIPSAEKLMELAQSLVVSPAEILSQQEDLDDGIKVCRKNEGFVRSHERKGKSYYTYQHLATSSAAPELMALRVSVHCNDEDDIVLNGGHDSKELVYVSRGRIRMHWKTASDVRDVDLNEGDSVFLAPNVPHSFRSLDAESELLAFNYRFPA